MRDKPFRVTFVLPPSIKAQLDLLAAQDGRSLSNYIRQVVTAHVQSAEAQGRIPPQPDNLSSKGSLGD